MSEYFDKRQEFWETNVESWNQQLYGEKKNFESFINWATLNPPKAKHFRQYVALEHLKPHVQDKHVVELGCGTGRLSQKLIQLGAKSYLGIDLAQSAVDIGTNQAKNAGLNDRIKFKQSEVLNLSVIKADFIMSVGLIHWLTWKEIEHLFSISQNIPFFHTISEPEYSFRQFLRYIYKKITGPEECHAFYRSLEDIRDVVWKNYHHDLYSFKHSDLYSIACLSSLPFPSSIGPQYVHTAPTQIKVDQNSPNVITLNR